MRIGQADILHRCTEQAPRNIEGIGAPVQHTAHPVKRGVGIGTAQRFMKRRDLVVKLVAALVETTHPARKRATHVLRVYFRGSLDGGRGSYLLKKIEQP